MTVLELFKTRNGLLKIDWLGVDLDFLIFPESFILFQTLSDSFSKQETDSTTEIDWLGADL